MGLNFIPVRVSSGIATAFDDEEERRRRRLAPSPPQPMHVDSQLTPDQLSRFQPVRIPSDIAGREVIDAEPPAPAFAPQPVRVPSGVEYGDERLNRLRRAGVTPILGTESERASGEIRLPTRVPSFPEARPGETDSEMPDFFTQRLEENPPEIITDSIDDYEPKAMAAALATPTRTMHSSKDEGKWGRIKDAFRMFLKGLGNPIQMTGDPVYDLMQRLGGGVGGFAGGAINPQAAHDLKYENEMAGYDAERERDYKQRKRELEEAAVTGVDSRTGKPTLNAERYQSQQANADERIRQAEDRLKLADKRFALAEKENRIRRLLEAGRIPGRKFTPEAKAQLESELGVILSEEFDPAQYDVQPDGSGNLQLIKINKGSGTATASPVLDQSGQPVQGPRPQSFARDDAEAQAIESWLKDRGYQSLDQMVDNPDFQTAFDREKAGAVASSKQYGTPMPSDDAIRARVGRKIKQKVPAHTLLPSEEIKRRAARFRGQGGGQSSSAPRQGGPQTFQPTRQTITQKEYDDKVSKWGKARVDTWLKQQGITVQ